MGKRNRFERFERERSCRSGLDMGSEEERRMAPNNSRVIGLAGLLGGSLQQMSKGRLGGRCWALRPPEGTWSHGDMDLEVSSV